jgi:Tfp pilus assembly protein PilF
MDKRVLIIGGAVLLIILILLLLLFTGAFGGAPAPLGAERDNTLKLARDYLNDGEYQTALDLINGLLKTNYDDKEARDLRDEIIKRKKDAESKAPSGSQTTTIIREVITGDSDVKRPSSERPQVEIPENATAQEKERLNKIRDLLTRGIKQMNDSQYDAARGSFNEALQIDPKLGEAYARIGQAYLEENPDNHDNIQKALENSRKAIAYDPDLSLPHFTLGQIYEKEKQWDNAEK